MKKFLTIALVLVFVGSLSANAQQSIKTTTKSDVFIQENFEGAAMPEGWTEQLGEATQGWGFNEGASSSSWTIPSHTTYASVNDDACNCDMSDVWLILKQVDFSSATHPFLEVDYIAKSFQNSVFKLKASVDGGSNWTDLYDIEESSSWVHGIYDLSSLVGEANVKLAFHYNDGGGWEYGFAIDNVLVYNPDENDLYVNNIFPPFVPAGLSIAPIVSVQNIGSSEVSGYQVNLTDGVSYNQTVTVNNSLSFSEIETVSFPEWTPTAGNYNLTAQVIYDNDQDLSNNTYSSDCEVEKLVYEDKVYASKLLVGQTIGQYGTFEIEDSSFTEIGECSNYPFPVAEEFNGNCIYRLYQNGNISIVSPNDGSDIITIAIGNLGNIYPAGISWDWETGTMYIISSEDNGASSDTRLGKINLSTFEYTEIGKSVKGIIAIDMADDGFLYGPSILDSKLYKINPANAATDTVGSIGTNINYAQDVSYDKESNRLYSVIPKENQPGVIFFMFGYYNLATAEFKEITEFHKQFLTFAMVDNSLVPVNIYEEQSCNIFPNPTKGLVQVKADGKFILDVFDIAGNKIYSEKMTDFANFDISSQKSGVYIVRLIGEKETKTFKILKQ